MERFVLEENVRFSESRLWQWQRRFFQEHGPAAWSRAIVPHYITSNPFIANAYARVVFGLLRDTRDELPDEPLHVVELGAGSGRFAFYFLKALTALCRRAGLGERPFVYVMTDFADATIRAWREHPSLRAFAEAGVLDFARFDHESDREFALTRSGVRLAPGSLNRPLVVLANYYFDGVRQDVFRVHGGKLSESLVSLSSPGAEPDLDDPALLGRVELSFQDRPITTEGYYGENELNRILRDYQERLTDTSLTIPIGALRCCRLLQQIAGGRMLLLSADKGFVGEAALAGQGTPAITVHGSFSMRVNYHAIGEYFRAQGGDLLRAPHAHHSLVVAGFLVGEQRNGYAETRHAFADAIGQFGPDEFFTLKKGIDSHYASMTLPQIIALLRLSHYDPRILSQCVPALSAQIASASQRELERLHWAIQQSWDLYFHIGERSDFAFELGVLLVAMDYLPDALQLFARSIELYGPDSNAMFNMALCHLRMRQTDEALQWCDRVLVIDPAHAPARAMRLDLQNRLRV